MSAAPQAARLLLMNKRQIVLCSVAWAMAAGPVYAEDTPPVAPTPAPQVQPCEQAEYRQFDFWLGRWEVRNPQGKVVGYNRVARDYGACVIREAYRGKGGFRGESLNTYDPGRDLWTQTWVDNQGTLLRLQGQWQGTSMRLEGQVVSASGVADHRIRWTPLPDGGVRQLWEQRAADEPQAEWTVVFDGWYRKVSMIPDAKEQF